MSDPLVAVDARLVGREATGDATYWTGLLQGLARVNPELRFLLFSNAPKPEGIPDSPRFTWVTAASRRPRWWSLFQFPLKARRMGARAIHTQYNLSPLAGSKGITTVHDVSFLIAPEWFRPLDRVVLRRFVPPSVRRSARVITVSETSKSDILRFLPFAQDKVRVTPLAVNPLIEPMPEDAARQVVTDQLGVEGAFLLTVGTRWPRKNMALAVRAAETLPADLAPLLVITGKPGWGEQELGARGRAVGYVSNDQLSALYSCATLYLATSFYEGFGLTVLEAFACGCPVACSAGGALPEVAGDAALIIPDWEPATWSGALRPLLADSSKLRAMRDAGRERASQFSWEDTARRTAAVYFEVIQ